MDVTTLQKGIDYGILNVDSLAEKIKEMENKEYLSRHSQSIWQGKNGFWYTYLPDGRDRRLIKKRTEEQLKDAVIEFYREDMEHPTMETVFEEWVTQKQEYGELKKQSVDRYRNLFSEFYGEEKGRKIWGITELWLEDFIKKRLALLKPTQRTWSNVKTITNGMFKYALKHGYSNMRIKTFFEDLEVSKNVICRSRKEDKEQVFEDDEVKQIIETCESKGTLVYLGIEIAMYTGIRVGELTALKFEDFNGGVLRVERTEVRYKNGDGTITYDIQPMTKGRDGARNVIISPKVTDVIERIKKIKGVTEPDDYIFWGTVHKGAFTNCLYRICGRLGIPPRSMHKLRKTYGTKLIDARIPDSLIISQMGHTDISTTRNFYYYNNHNLTEAKALLEGVDYG